MLGRMVAIMAVAVALAGCADGSQTDADGDHDEDLIDQSEPLSFSETVQLVGSGVPTVACPATETNSQSVTWTIAPPAGEAHNVTVTDLVFRTVSDDTVLDVDLFVSGPGGASGASNSGDKDEEVRLSGERDTGDYVIEARACRGSGDVEIQAEGTLNWKVHADDV